MAVLGAHQLQQTATEQFAAVEAEQTLDGAVDVDDVQLAIGHRDEFPAGVTGGHRRLGQSQPLSRTQLAPLQRQQFVQTRAQAAALGVKLSLKEQVIHLELEQQKFFY